MTAEEFINKFQDEFRENREGVVRQLMISYAKYYASLAFDAGEQSGINSEFGSNTMNDKEEFLKTIV